MRANIAPQYVLSGLQEGAAGPSRDDLLVVPEYYGPGLDALPGFATFPS